ncbi:MAG TPA: hypothetical protein VKA41_01755 [Solirubrobacterales bacterium]|nr:hypothetical protein [Solirubrobacterales bacterium]
MAALLASALPKAIEEVGAIAGIASFVVMLALFGLYIVRALELRKLRRTMPFLVNPQNGKPDNGRSPKSSGRA